LGGYLGSKRSTYLGNWFPSLPQLSISQSNRILTTDKNKPEADDYSQSWYANLAIKRVGNSQLIIHAGQKKRQQTLTANDGIPYFSADLSNTQEAITIQKDQQAKVLYTENNVGLSFVFLYHKQQPLTQITLQQRTIVQPIQANITGLPHHSLYNTQVQLIELGINSNSYRKGLNINWGVALAVGDINIDSNKIPNSDEKHSEIMNAYAVLELYYQYRFNRRWFTFSRWQGEVNYWRQGTSDNPEYELSEVNNIEQQIYLGLGFSF